MKSIETIDQTLESIEVGKGDHCYTIDLLKTKIENGLQFKDSWVIYTAVVLRDEVAYEEELTELRFVEPRQTELLKNFIALKPLLKQAFHELEKQDEYRALINKCIEEIIIKPLSAKNFIDLYALFSGDDEQEQRQLLIKSILQHKKNYLNDDSYRQLIEEISAAVEDSPCITDEDKAEVKKVVNEIEAKWLTHLKRMILQGRYTEIQAKYDPQRKRDIDTWVTGLLVKTGGGVDLVREEINEFLQGESDEAIEMVIESFYRYIIWMLQLTREGLYAITHPRTQWFDLPELVAARDSRLDKITSTQQFKLVQEHCKKQPFSHTAIAMQLLIDSAEKGSLQAEEKDLKEGAAKHKTRVQTMASSVANFFSFRQPEAQTASPPDEVELEERKMPRPTSSSSKPGY